MADEGFLRRWSRLKGGDETLPESATVSATMPAVDGAQPAISQPAASPPAASPPAQLPPPPTLADAAALQSDSDFSLFVARNVDAAVRRLAMKKLFSDPHFHGHDGLDIYMGDYTVASPVSPDMFEQLAHSKSVFRKLDEAIEQLDAAPAPALTPDDAQAGDTATPPPPPDQEVA